MPTSVADTRVDLISLGRDLAELSPKRCEALLHAWPQDPRDELPHEDWAEPFVGRWEEVAAVMADLDYLTWDRERVEEEVLAAAATRW